MWLLFKFFIPFLPFGVIRRDTHPVTVPYRFSLPTELPLQLTSRPYFSTIFLGIVRQGAVTRSISRRLLYPFVTRLAPCRHLAGAVNWHFYSVMHHSIPVLVLVGYQPNDKERISPCSNLTTNILNVLHDRLYIAILRYCCIRYGCSKKKNV